jgi:hypothetical protein
VTRWSAEQFMSHTAYIFAPRCAKETCQGDCCKGLQLLCSCQRSVAALQPPKI